MGVKRLEGVDRVVFSLEQQLVAVTYRPGEGNFDAKGLREAIVKAQVRVVRFHFQAKGEIEPEGEERFFVSGKDRFLVQGASEAPSGAPVEIMATVDDSTTPMQLTIDDFRVLDP